MDNNSNNNPNREDELLKDAIDVEIENLSFEVDGDATLNGNASLDNVNSNDLNGNAIDPGSDMIDTSDDNLSNENSSDNSSSSLDNTNEGASTTDDSLQENSGSSSESTSLPEGSEQKDVIDDGVNNVSDSDGSQDAVGNNDLSNNGRENLSNSDDSEQNSSNGETTDSDDGNKKGKNSDNNDSKDKGESLNNENNKKGLTEDKKGDDNPKNEPNKDKGSNQDKSNNPNKDKNNQGNKPDNPNKDKKGQGNNPNKKTNTPPKTKDEKDKDNAAKGMTAGGSGKYANKANNMANRAAKRADNAAKKAKRAEEAAKRAQGTNRAARANRKANRAANRAARTAKRADRARKVASTVTKLSKTLTIAKLVIAGVVFLAIIIFSVINSFGAVITPGQGNDIKDEFSGFSENDKKILEEVNQISGITKPNAELAVYTVLFPYFESLQDGSVNSYLNGDSSNLDEDEQNEYDKNSSDSETREKILESFGCEDICQELLGNEGTNQIIKAYAKKSLKTKFKEFFGLDTSNDELNFDDFIMENENEDNSDENAIGETDDPYLKLLKKQKYQKSLEKLLEKLEASAEEGDYDSETAFFDYLKSDYFESDAGYKALLIQSSDEEALKDAIIEQLKAGAGSYEVYIKDHCSTSYNFESGGQINPTDEDIKNMMMGNVVIDLLAAGCGNTSTCPSYYNTPITLEKYVKGVVYEELGSSNDLEQIKAQMVAAKSYTLSRHKPSKTDDGVYVIKMRWSTADQDYCDYETGCNDVQAEYGYENVGDCVENCKHWANRDAASDEKVALYNQAWEETKNVYVVDSDGIPRGSYMEGCSKGKCMDQAKLEKMVNVDYQSILQSFYTDYSIAMQDGEFATVLIGTSSKVCANGNGNSSGIPDDKFKFYYQTDYSDLFCGSSATISKAGCGGTSYAMLVANLSNETNFSPVDASNEGTKTDYCGADGTSDGLFTDTLSNKHTGFTAKTIEVSLSGAQEVLNVIRNGGLVAANVQKNSPFTGGGHWILIRGITEDGKVKVADPASKDKSLTGTYDINDFIEQQYFLDSNGGGFNHNWISIYGPKSEEIKNTYNTVISGDGKTTGYLKSPFGINETNEEARKHLNGNPSTLYYASRRYHGAIDFAVAEGTQIYAMDGGEVVTSQNKGSYGNHIIIKHVANDKTYYTLYAHLSKRNVNVGDKVSQGQLIGLSGNTGNSSGPHLHAELINSIDCLGHNCKGVHYNVLKYIGETKTYVGQKCDGAGC